MHELPVNLGPRYRALATLGKGGMGAVYLGQRLRGDGLPPELVAIKVMHSHVADNADSVARFIDEARIGTRIRHPNVVHVHDAEVIAETPFIVMEYIEGISWSRILRRASESNTTIPTPVIARVIRELLAGLGAAHAAGAIHRDVSPQNVLVAADGRVYITDFGVASFAGRLAATAPGDLRGKLGYMSPEQVARTAEVDGRADVFAAGIILWEALTNRLLFIRDTQTETLAGVLSEPIDPPSLHASDISPELEDVCLKALERSVDRRYPSAHAFATALEKVVTVAPSEELAALVRSLCGDVLDAQRQARESAQASTEFISGLSTVTSGEVTVTSLVNRGVQKRTSRARGAMIVAGAAALLVVGSVLGRMTSSSAPAPSAESTTNAPPPVLSEPPVVTIDTAVLPTASSIPTIALTTTTTMSAPKAVRKPPHHVSTQRPSASVTPPRPPGPFVPPEL